MALSASNKTNPLPVIFITTQLYTKRQLIRLSVSASPTKPLVSASPTKPLVSASLTKPLVSASPTKPLVSASPTKPLVSASPTKPLVSASPTKHLGSDNGGADKVSGFQAFIKGGSLGRNIRSCKAMKQKAERVTYPCSNDRTVR